jgi:hypothetical protein
MQMAGSSMRDIVAQDLQEIPRVLATIRSVMCVLRARLILKRASRRSLSAHLHLLSLPALWQERMGHAGPNIPGGQDGQKLLDVARIL